MNQVKTATAVARTVLSESLYKTRGKHLRKYVLIEDDDDISDDDIIIEINGNTYKEVGTFKLQAFGDVYGNTSAYVNLLTCWWAQKDIKVKGEWYTPFRVDILPNKETDVEGLLCYLKENQYLICGEVQKEPGLFQQRKAPEEYEGIAVIEAFCFMRSKREHKVVEEKKTAKLSRAGVSID